MPLSEKQTNFIILSSQDWLTTILRNADVTLNVRRATSFLCHHPEYWSLREPPLINQEINLVLSGYEHGRQVQIFGQGIYAPGQGWLPTYTRGVYNGRLIFSRGLANTAYPVPRILNQTEVVHVEMNPSCSVYR